MTHRILFVCLGNICRSPAAEGVFRALMPEASTDSAGTASWHVGKPPYGPMQDAARQRRLEIGDLRARQFQPDDFDRFDLIVGMDAENIENIEALRTVGNDTPVCVLTDYIDDPDIDHVPDPYYTRDFDGALDLIERAAQGLKRSLT
ncbi:low molecular weight protein-tyrosine-phosphatase [Falsiruegeria mediterranea]|uniref:protein-tyrosine-phosphatase n=1 Tax=Falsiruegeria mediterranea M17 TaxID=1200281 RepID=A0A2R8C7V8_9RHOB|nr:low molecular weight protein-tyrosine-phosphatase [Falsiruegeria mediterranea]SPJ28436.1 Low molecular weight protein-tyrosine-phosphatase YfkJ [Falsiruegeria mediterranea M17]